MLGEEGMSKKFGSNCNFFCVNLVIYQKKSKTLKKTLYIQKTLRY